MKNLLLVLAFCFISFTIAAQQTRHEITRVTTPFDDNKPNSDQVPEVYAHQGNFKEIVVLRFKFQTDLLAGIDSMAKVLNIKNAVILSGMGSVRGYHIHVVSNRTFPSKNIFIKDPTAPADIINTNGFIINGRVHAHVTLADADKSFGGHLELGTPVFSFAVISIGVFGDDVNLDKADDKNYR